MTQEVAHERLSYKKEYLQKVLFSNGKTILFESWGLSRGGYDAQDGVQEALEGQGFKTQKIRGSKLDQKSSDFGPVFGPTWGPKQSQI